MKNRIAGLIITWLVVVVCALMPRSSVAEEKSLDQQLIEASGRGDVEQVKALLDRGTDE